MTDKQAKRQLKKMLQTFTAGSILHLLAELHQDLAEKAQWEEDSVSYEQCKLVKNALIVIGMGVDAARPR